MTLRVGIVCDYREEGWPSMDLVAEMLLAELPLVAPDIQPEPLRPPWRRRATRLPAVGATAMARRIDRYSNRYADYSLWLWRRRSSCDVFHVVDHSYAHLSHVLPPERTLVTCHDVDALRGLADRRGGLSNAMARRILSGLRRAAMVICVTRATQEDLVSHGWISPDRTMVVHNGVHPAMLTPGDCGGCRELDAMIGPAAGIELLHVGSTIPRKRVDVLLRAVAEVRRDRPSVRVLRVGGTLTDDQRRLARELGLSGAIVDVPPLASAMLAALYRRAVLTLLPSEREGFGLPVVESLACGTPVAASRLPSIVEVGADLVAYAPAGDPAAFASAIRNLLDERDHEPGWWSYRREEGRRRAQSFRWTDHAADMADLYRLIGQRCAQAHSVAS